MSTPLAQTTFSLAEAASADDLIAALREQSQLESEPSAKLRRTYFDTFDWLVYQAGGALELKSSRERKALIWYERGSSQPVTSVLTEVAKFPEFARDLPAGALARRVADAIGVRRLLPLAELRSELQLLRVLDEERKTVARVRVEEPSVKQGRTWLPLRPCMTVVAVRGYAKAFERTVTALARADGAVEGGESLFSQALLALDRSPLDYSSKINVPLTSVMRADAATHRIMLGLLDTLEANIDGTRRDLDAEFLHDLRVATRRTRSGLTQIKGVFPEAVLEDFKKRFGWLGQVTGPTRDLDVFLEDYPRYRASLPESLQPDLEPLRDFLVRHQQQEQRLLRRRLGSPHFYSLLRDWRAYLEAELAEHPEAPNAMGSIGELAGARVWRMFRRVLREGRAITDASPNEDLHELRKSCKKLRYLIEFFQGLYRAEDIKPLIKALKGLLDNLGTFQDLEVQAEHLEDFAQTMQEEDAGPPRTLLAMGALVGDLLRRQHEVRTEFKARFSAFDGEKNRAAYRRLFKGVT